MSNESRYNPRSRQYRLAAGASADPICMAAIGCEVVPSEKWKAANPAVEGEENVALVPPEECEVRFLIVGRYVEPSHLAPQEKWATGAAPVAEIHRMPLEHFRALIQRECLDQPWRSKTPGEGLDS